MFDGAYRGTRVLITGHTGFKGSWLALWLEELGAEVTGFSLAPPTQPSHFDLARPRCKDLRGDIQDAAGLAAAMRDSAPDLVFHLAAQPLVRLSYADPAGTFASNVMGTLHLLTACRDTPSVKAVVVVTSDKCYRNQEWDWGYRENDALGGRDPYSCSKACAELLTASFRASYLEGPRNLLAATVRAGNAIGGGDWGQDRLVPDLVLAAAQGRPALLRNPASVRPWQHVLDPLSGYLQLGRLLLQGRRDLAEAWNFGPDQDRTLTVAELAGMLAEGLQAPAPIGAPPADAPHEAGLLRLDSGKARARLGWKPVWDARTSIAKTAQWVRAYLQGNEILSRAQLAEYVQDAQDQGLAWAGSREGVRS